MAKIRPIATTIFNCFCLILAVYMTIKQINTYLSNDDESVISFEDIKETSSEDFATYTICLLMDNGAGMYKRDELIYSAFNWNGPGQSKFMLELEGNKLIVLNKSEVKDRGQHWGTSNETNFFYDPLFNPSRCDFGEMKSIPTGFDSESFDHCDAENEVFRTYSQGINREGSLMTFKRDDKLYAIDYFQYHDILMGINSTIFKYKIKCFEGELLRCKMVPIQYSLEDIIDMDFDEHTKDLTLFLLNYDAETINGSKVNWFTELYLEIETNKSSGPEMEGLESRNSLDNVDMIDIEEKSRLFSNPIIKVYQDPTRKCYSPQVNRTLKKKRERITLNLEQVMHNFKGIGDGGPFVTPFVEIHIHPHGQFLRTIGKEIATYILDDFFADCPEMGWGVFGSTCHGSSISFDLSQVTLLKSRHDAEISCDKNLRDEDTLILESVLNHTGIQCIPMYWNSIIKNRLNYSECTTDSQYKMISEFTANFVSYEKVRGSFDPPCMDMLIVTNVNKEPGRPRQFYNIKQSWWGSEYKEILYLDIDISHLGEQYQAIINTRGFTIESCWAGIGGFVGIFVGVSLMQVPDVIIETIHLMKKLKAKA